MNKLCFFAVLLFMSVSFSCSANKESDKTIDQNNNAATKTTTPAADNTARNEQDRYTKAVTPADQLENSTDLEITQKIRQSIMDDSSLSTYAKNVKIITQNQGVTLRGVVNTAQEKQKIEAIAKQIAPKNVTNELEVKTGS